MVDCVEFYRFAGCLFTQNFENEIAYRTVINRAYYSAFLGARTFSKITNSSGSVHKEVIAYFENRANREIFNQLQQLKKLRQIADYQLETTLSKRDAAKSLKLAEHILKKLNYLP